MGYFEHKTIVVTGEGYHFDNAYKKAKELFATDNEGKEVNMVSNVVGTGMNQYYSFFISPSGSKAGWDMDEYFNEKFKIIAKEMRLCTENFVILMHLRMKSKLD